MMNDTSIAREITSRYDPIKWCDEDDSMIVDRRFRDIVETFIEMGYEPKTPDFLSKEQNQHTLEQANRSCLIINVRWRIESYHAHMKRRTLFNGRIESTFIPKAADSVPIVSAALNCC